MIRKVVMMLISVVITTPLVAGHSVRAKGVITDIWSVETITKHGKAGVPDTQHKALYLVVDTGDRDTDPTINMFFQGSILDRDTAVIDTPIGQMNVQIGDRVSVVCKFAHARFGFGENRFATIIRLEVLE